MTEQKLEKIVIDKIAAAFDNAGISSYQMIGSWQVANDDELKALEQSDAKNVVCVKVMPRQYDTPTVPYAMFAVQLNVLTRAEMDAQGANWFEATEIVQSILQAWQSKHSNIETDFAIEDEFTPSGFNIAGGDVGIDKENCIWQFNQSFDLYGVII